MCGASLKIDKAKEREKRKEKKNAAKMARKQKMFFSFDDDNAKAARDQNKQQKTHTQPTDEWRRRSERKMTIGKTKFEMMTKTFIDAAQTIDVDAAPEKKFRKTTDKTYTLRHTSTQSPQKWSTNFVLKTKHFYLLANDKFCRKD